MSRICKIAFTAVLISLISLCSISCATNDDGGSGSGSGSGHSGTYTFWKEGDFREKYDYEGDHDTKAKIFVLKTGDPDVDGYNAYAYMYIITEILVPAYYEVGDLYYSGMVDWFETNNLEETARATMSRFLGSAPASGKSQTYQYDEGSGWPKGNVTVTNNNNTLEVKFFK